MSNDAITPDDHDDEFEIDPVALTNLQAMLGDGAVWDETDPADEAAVLAAIDELASARDDVAVSSRAVASGPVASAAVPSVGMPLDLPAPIRATTPSSETSNVVPISRARRWVAPFAAGIAAALAVVVGVGAFTGDGRRDTVELALIATDLAPGASGVADIAETPNGTVLVLDVSGLPPAPQGSYYEAWVRQDAEVGVSAGTFHLRGGGGEVELWAGVSTDDYPLVTVTIQDEADPVSSGRVVLRGLLEE